MLERIKWLGAAVGIFALNALAQAGLFLPKAMGGYTLFNSSVAFIYMLSMIVLIFWIGQNFGLIGRSFAPIKKYLAWIFIGYGLIWVSNILGTVVLAIEGSGTTQNQTLLHEIMQQVPNSLMFLLIVFLAPIAEEIMCRGIIPQLLFKGYEETGYFIGGFVFAFMHGPTNVGSWIVYGGMSAVLTFLAYKSKRVEVSMGLHFLNNAIAFALLQLASHLV